MLRNLLAIGVVLLGGSCPAQSVDASRIAPIVDDAAMAALAKPGAAGLSVCIRLHGDAVLTKGYGVADAVDQRPVRPDSIFHACSTSKQFLAAAIMRLAEQGRLSLDDPITKHIPEFTTPGGVVTLRQLLSHTSGLKGYTEVAAFQAQEGRDMTHEELLALFQEQPPLFAPGERFLYCNTGWYLLGVTVERLSGKDYGAFLRDEFFTPLKLGRTAYDPHPADESQWALPHKVADGKAVRADQISWVNAFAGGGVSSTAGDLAAWMDALASGRAVSPDSYRQMTTPQKLNDGTPIAYGLGLYVREYRGHPVVFHTGGGPGCSAWIANYPADHLIIAVMSNSDAVWAPRLGIAMAMAIFGVDRTPRDLPMSHSELARYSGRFRWTPSEDNGPEPDDSRFYARDGHLWIDAKGGRTSRLLYQGDGTFVVEKEPGFTITFSGSPEGAPPLGCTGDGGVDVLTAHRIGE